MNEPGLLTYDELNDEYLARCLEIGQQVAEIWRLQAQRDALLAACRAALTAIKRLPEDALGMGFVQRGAAGFQYPIRDELTDNLRAAIAKAENGPAEGGQP